MSEQSSGPHASVRVTWRGDRRYEVNRPGASPATIDAEHVAGPGPVEMLLGALAACASVDVVDYLAKRRTPIARLAVAVDAVRNATAPRRVLSARLVFEVDGETIDVEHAERGLALAVGKYCSVASSLAPDVDIVTRLVLNGIAGAEVRQSIARGGVS